MSNVIPLTTEIEQHLPELTATDDELRHEVRVLLELIDGRRRRGWHKVPFYALARLRVLAGVPEPDDPYSDVT
jgi:hypothetical protein